MLALITQGLSNQEIAERTYLSINSVKTYIRTAYRKIDVSRRSQAVVWGMEHGFEPDRVAQRHAIGGALRRRPGAPGRTRTCDRRIRRPLLYPAELRRRGSETQSGATSGQPRCSSTTPADPPSVCRRRAPAEITHLTKVLPIR